MARRPRKLSDDDIARLVEREITGALNFWAGDITSIRERVLRSYRGEVQRRDGESLDEMVAEGRSLATDRSVFDVVETLMPEMMRTLFPGDNIVEFPPVSAEDIDAAEQATDYCNHVFVHEANGFAVMEDTCRSTLMEINATVYCGWDDSERVTSESYENLTEDQLAAFLTNSEYELVGEIRQQEQEVQMPTGDGAYVKVPTGQFVYDADFRRTRFEGGIMLKQIPPEEMIVSTDTTARNYNSSRFVGRKFHMTRSELLERGISMDVVAQLPADDPIALSNQQQLDLTRREYNEEYRPAYGSEDWSQEQVLVIDGYVRADRNGDGIAELLHIFKGGGQGNAVTGPLLEPIEEVDRQPFHSFVALPRAYKHYGHAVAEPVVEIQNENTILKRAIQDNLHQVNRPRKRVMEFAVDMESVRDTAINGFDLITTNDPAVAAQAVNYHQVPYTAAASYEMLRYNEEGIKERTGAGQGVAGLDSQVMRDVNTGVLASHLEKARGKVDLYVRNMAETGLKSLFLHMYELLCKHQPREKMVRLRNKWVPIDPTSWRDRSTATVLVGMGRPSREQRLMAYDHMLKRQEQIVQMGGMGTFTSPAHIYQLLADEAEVLLPGAQFKYYMDPERPTWQPPPPPQQPNVQQEALFLQAQIEQGNQQLKREQLRLDEAKLAMQRAEQQDKLAAEGYRATEQERTRRQEAMLGQRQADEDRASKELLEGAKIEQLERDSVRDNETRITVEQMKITGNASEAQAGRNERATVRAEEMSGQNGQQQVITGIIGELENSRSRAQASESELAAALQGIRDDIAAVRSETQAIQQRQAEAEARAQENRRRIAEFVRANGTDEGREFMDSFEGQS